MPPTTKRTRRPPAPSEPIGVRPSLRSRRAARGALGLLLLGLAAPFVGASYLGQVVAPQVAATTGRAAARTLSRLTPPQRRIDAARIEDELLLAEPPKIVATTLGARPRATRKSAVGRKPSRPGQGLFVGASLVRRAIQVGGRPTGSPIAASGDRPAGLILHGISRYGSALRDGDVLTSISGAQATSSPVVIGAILSAVRARSAAISGVVWRGNERFQVTVELPRS